MGVSNCVSELMAQHITQRRVATPPDVRQTRKRHPRDADVARTTKRVLTVSNSEWNQAGIHRVNMLIIKAVRIEFACDGVVGPREPPPSDEVHNLSGVLVPANAFWVGFRLHG